MKMFCDKMKISCDKIKMFCGTVGYVFFTFFPAFFLGSWRIFNFFFRFFSISLLLSVGDRTPWREHEPVARPLGEAGSGLRGIGVFNGRGRSKAVNRHALARAPRWLHGRRPWRVRKEESPTGFGRVCHWLIWWGRLTNIVCLIWLGDFFIGWLVDLIGWSVGLIGWLCWLIDWFDWFDWIFVLVDWFNSFVFFITSVC